MVNKEDKSDYKLNPSMAKEAKERKENRIDMNS